MLFALIRGTRLPFVLFVFIRGTRLPFVSFVFIRGTRLPFVLFVFIGGTSLPFVLFAFIGGTSLPFVLFAFIGGMQNPFAFLRVHSRFVPWIRADSRCRPRWAVQTAISVRSLFYDISGVGAASLVGSGTVAARSPVIVRGGSPPAGRHSAVGRAGAGAGAGGTAGFENVAAAGRFPRWSAVSRRRGTKRRTKAVQREVRSPGLRFQPIRAARSSFLEQPLLSAGSDRNARCYARRIFSRPSDTPRVALRVSTTSGASRTTAA